jgi:hypothetical protein
MAGERERTAMSKRRKWDARTKAMIVIQRLEGTPVADICTVPDQPGTILPVTGPVHETTAESAHIISLGC